MSTHLERRTFLRRAGFVGAAAILAPGIARPAAAMDDALAPFHHGVASGDPAADSVVLWTRVTPPEGHVGPVAVQWEIASDANFSTIVGSGTFPTDANRDYTVKVIPTGLSGFTYYWYRFSAFAATSIVGRTKTAPAAGQSVDKLRFGLVSCSNYEGGFFNAYARVSDRNDLDAVLCLGDYIYEYGQGGYGPGEEIGRVTQPEFEMATLDGYRARFGHYRLDPDLRRAHQLFPWINTWDDHETTNDSWAGGAENHDDTGEISGDDNVEETGLDWEERKARAWQAYREWLPIRPDTDQIELYRSVAYGDLADIVVMDTRIDGREQPAAQVLEPALFTTEIDRADRRMITDAQQSFVYDALANSTASWRILAQQVMMMQWRIPALPDGVAGAPDFPAPGITEGGNAVNGDAWDGYTAERANLWTHLRDNDISDVVVLTGDIHSAWAADLTEDPDDPLTYDVTGQNPLVPRNLGVEFVVTSVTSDNIDEIVMEEGGSRESGIAAARGIETATLANNPHIKMVDLERHGYGLLDVTAERVTYDVFFVDTILEPSDGEAHHMSWSVDKGTADVVGHRVVQVAEPSAARATSPDAPAAQPVQATTTTTSTVPRTSTPSLPATGGSGFLLGGAAAAAFAVAARRSAVAAGRSETSAD